MKRRSPDKKKIVIGITGSFGSGKTSVARILRHYGARLIDADRLAHDCIKPHSSAYKKIIAVFGKGVLKKNRIIDRKKLARIVFNNKELLKKLNNLIHPQVTRDIKDIIRNSREGMVVLDAPLLIEAGLQGLVDKLIVVTLSQKEQLRRLKKKSSLTRADILKRIKCQIPLRQKMRIADFVIDNNGSIKETARQVEQIRRRLLWKN